MKHDLDAKVVYELILSHGREDLYLFYAGLMRDHGKVVEHWVTEEAWTRAIDVLNRQVSHVCALVQEPALNVLGIY